MSLALYTILILYLLLIFFLLYGFDQVPVFIPKKSTPTARFSVIVPFRNEEKNVPKLIKSLLELHYSKTQFEVLFVDDDSNDSSVDIIQSLLNHKGISFQILSNKKVSNSPKKDAILTAISQARFEWIVTTDADCVVPPLWLQTIAEFSEVRACEMIVAPVAYESGTSSLLNDFQQMDFLSLQGSTIGGFGIHQPFLCNGANLIYQKNAFLELNGFQGNDQIASGDDIFLFEKFVKAFPKKVHFLKSTSAMVTTFPLNSWKEVIQQRMRWAAKSSSYQLFFAKFVGLIVFLMNVGILVAFGLLISNREFIETFLILFILKTGVDFLLIQKTFHFYRGQKERLRNYVPAATLYPFFSVFVVIKTLFSAYQWKGRSFKK